MLLRSRLVVVVVVVVVVFATNSCYERLCWAAAQLFAELATPRIFKKGVKIFNKEKFEAPQKAQSPEKEAQAAQKKVLYFVTS
eukprot:SAG22_NODE_8327_length_664_cov_1.107965_2_plen_82_part_01